MHTPTAPKGLSNWLHMEYYRDDRNSMKRTALILGIVLTLSGSTSNLRAHGGCYGFWPFWPLALFGAGLAVASVASAHSSPTYVYAPPAYPYGYAYSYAQPQHSYVAPPAQAPAPTSAPAAPAHYEISSWVPSSPGPGHWVPDATPYSYSPGVQTKMVVSAAEPATFVTVNRSAGNVPVYTVTR